MGAATQERPGTETETDEQRIERENAEQAERLAAEQEALDNDTPAQAAGKDGQAHAKQVDAPPEELLVAGTTQLELLPSLGGKKPTGSTVTVQGLGSIPVMQGQAFEKGQLIRGEFVAMVESVNQKDKVDRKAGVAVDCKQIHTAYATDIRLFPASAPRLPDDADLAERVSAAVELLGSADPDIATALDLLRNT